MTERKETKFQYKSVFYRSSTNCDKPAIESPAILCEKFVDNVISDNSPRVNGKISYRPCELQRYYHKSYGGPMVASKIATNPVSPLYSCAVEKVYSLYSYQTLVPTLAHESVDEARYQALNKFYDKVRNSKFNAAQAYAERKQAISMIGQGTRRLASLFRSLRRGRNPFNGRRCNSKDAGNLWLEYSYGWVPLVSDIYGACRFSKGEPPSMRCKVSVKKPYFVENNRVQAILSPLKMNISEKLDGHARVTCDARVVVTDPSLAFSSEIGLTNPAGLAWELLPYSFVVDWFIPIGGWLNGLTDTIGLGLHYTSMTSTVNVKHTLDASVFSTSNVVSGSARSTVLKGDYRQKERLTTLSSRPLPQLKNPLNTYHALSGLALLRQAFH